MRRTNYIIRSLALAAAAALTGVCICGCKAGRVSEQASGYSAKTEYSYSIDELAGTISDALAEYDNHTDYDAAIEQGVLWSPASARKITGDGMVPLPIIFPSPWCRMMPRASPPSFCAIQRCVVSDWNSSHFHTQADGILSGSACWSGMC